MKETLSRASLPAVLGVGGGVLRNTGGHRRDIFLANTIVNGLAIKKTIVSGGTYFNF